MDAGQNSQSLIAQLRSGANMAQNQLSTGLSQKIGNLGVQSFANLLNNRQPAQVAKQPVEQAHLMANEVPKNTSTKEFLNRRQVQQNMGSPAQSAPATGLRNGTLVRTGNTTRTTGTANRHNFGMVDTRRNKGAAAQSSMQANPAQVLAKPANGQIGQAIVMASDLNLAAAGQTLIPGINLSPEQNFQQGAVSNLAVLNKMFGPEKTNSGAIAGFSKFVSTHAAQLEQRLADAALTLRTRKHRPTEDNMATGAGVGQELTGALSARYESGAQGIAAIGYDRHGGTSYGKFQISSRAGTMKNFISYLDEHAPDLGERLKNAGPSNTRGRGGKMPEEWQAIAAEDPERFEKLQDDFIKSSHFAPAAQALAANKGIDFTALPGALQEVLFSTAVQHGAHGATRIIGKALDRLGINLEDFQTAITAENKSSTALQQAKKLVEHIYDLRANQFGSSTKNIQVAARQRMQREKQEALQLLEA